MFLNRIWGVYVCLYDYYSIFIYQNIHNLSQSIMMVKGCVDIRFLQLIKYGIWWVPKYCRNIRRTMVVVVFFILITYFQIFTTTWVVVDRYVLKTPRILLPRIKVRIILNLIWLVWEQARLIFISSNIHEGLVFQKKTSCSITLIKLYRTSSTCLFLHTSSREILLSL